MDILMKKYRRRVDLTVKVNKTLKGRGKRLHFQQANITRAIIWPYSNRYYDNVFPSNFIAVKNFSFKAIFLVELLVWYIL